MKNLRILLINPFFLIEGKYDVAKIGKKVWEIDPPLGLGSLSAYIKKHFGKDVVIEVFDANAMAINEIVRSNKVDMPSLYGLAENKIKSFMPDIVGVSALFEFCGDVALTFVDIAKSVDKDIVTIMGGAFASYSYNRAFVNPNLDYIVQGEGEEGLRQFIEFQLGQRTIETVGSLIYRCGTAINSNPQVFVDDLSAIPWVDRSNLWMDMYATRSTRVINRFTADDFAPRLASIYVTRGCPHRCGFCSTRLLWGKSIRQRSIPDVMNEIEWLKGEYDINTLSFNDDNLSADREYFAEFLRQLKKQHIRWLPSGFQLSSMTDEIINLCIESGLICFQVAFESGSNETLKRIRKPLRIEQSEKFVERVRSINPRMYIYGGWITGLPFETMEDIETTHAFAKHLDLDWSSFFCYQPYPGTELYRYCVEKGYVQKDERNIKCNTYLLSAISTENFSSEDLIYKNYCANIDLNFLNNRNLKGRGNLEQAYRDFIDMAFVYPTHIFAHIGLSEYYAQKNDQKTSDYYYTKAKECAAQDNFYKPYIEHFQLGERLFG